MSDRMTPIPFSDLMNWILEEHKQGSVFGIRRPFAAEKGKVLELFGEHLETPFGPAAGPHTQLAQNIVAAYYAGCRFFELKTVQTLDGERLRLRAWVGSASDGSGVSAQGEGDATQPQALGRAVAADLLAQGAGRFLD